MARKDHPHHLFVLGVFNNQELVYQCVTELLDEDFQSEDISIYSSNPDMKTSANFLELEKSTKGPESAITGAGIGATVGCALGGIFGTGLVPEFHGFTALGPMSTALWGFAMGGMIGGIAGGLIGSRVPEDDAKNFQKSLQQNETLLTVRVKDREEARNVKVILEVSGATKILFNQDQEKFSESIVLDKRPGFRPTHPNTPKGEPSTWNH